jgi:hypothetical protein
MTTADRVRAAKSPQEAMLAVAEALDQLLAREPAKADDGWGAWPVEDRDDHEVDPNGFGTAEPFAVIKPKVSDAEVRAAEEELHQAEINFEAAHASNLTEEERAVVVQELKRAQAKLRFIQGELEGGIVNNAGFIPGSGEATVTREENGQIVVDLPPVDDTRKAARRKLAEAIDLPGFFPMIFRSGPPRDQILHAFEVGGPLWLSNVGKEDGQVPVIRQLPFNVRQAMVEDLRLDSERLAHELATDILNDVDPVHLDVSGQNIDGVIAHGGTPYQGKGDS